MSVRNRDDADGVRQVLAETSAVADNVKVLLIARNPSTRIERSLLHTVMWQMRVRVPGLRESDVLVEQFDHVSSVRQGLRGRRHREGPGGSPDERAAWIVDEIYSRPSSRRASIER